MQDGLGYLKKLALEDTAAQKTNEVEERAALKRALFGGDVPPAAAPQDILAQRQQVIAKKEAERVAREEDAFVKDRDRGTLKGFFGQAAAVAVEGGNQLVADIASAPSALAGQNDLAPVSDEAKAAWQKEDRTPEDEALLDSVPEFLLKESVNPRDHKTNRELLESGTASLDTASEIRAGFENSAASRRVNKLSQDGLVRDLKSTFGEQQEYWDASEAALDRGDYAEAAAEGFMGVAKSLVNGGIKDLLSNPAAVTQIIGEEIPQLLVGAAPRVGSALLKATNAAYAVGVYEQGRRAFEETNGRMATNEEEAQILGFALTAYGAEQIADSSLLNSITGKLSSPVQDAVAKVAKKTALDATIGVLAAGGGKALDVGLKVAKAVNKAPLRAAGRVAKGTTKGFVTEGATEAYQTAVEENFSQLEFDDIAGEEIFLGGMLGGAAGGGIRGGGDAAREVVELGKQAKDAAENPDKKVQREAFAAAVETGDVSEFLDPAKRATYDPTKAAGVLAQRQLRDDLEDGVREKEAKQLNDLVSEQQTVVDGISEEFDALLEQEKVSGSDVQRLEQRAKEESAKLKKMKVAAMVPTIAERPDAETVDSMVEQASTAEVTPESEQAAKATITLMMRDPQAVGLEKAEKLLSSPSFTPEQKEYLQHFTTAHAEINALKDLDKVSNEVLQGGRGFKGLYEYEVDVNQAVRDQDQTKATGLVDKLREFARERQFRQQALATAVEAVESGKSKDRIYIVKDPSKAKGYQITRKEPEGWNRNLNGGLEVGTELKDLNGAKKLLRTMKAETIAVNEMGKALASQVSLSFDAPGTAGATPQPAAAPTDTSLEESNEGIAEETVEADTASATPEPTPAPAETRSDPALEETPQSEVVAESEPASVEPEGAEAQQEPEVTVEPADRSASETSSPTLEDLLRQELANRPELDVDDETSDVESEDEYETVTLENGRVIPQAEDAPEVTGNLPITELTKTKRKLLPTYFTQRGDESELVTMNPLVAIKDFFDQILSEDGTVDFEMVEIFLKEGTNLNVRQKAALNALATMVQQWTPLIQKSMGEAARNDFQILDLSQQFDPQEEKNAVAAIALSAFLYLAENGNGPGRNNHKDIAKILGLGSKDRLPEGAFELLAEAGDRQNLVIQGLGGRARSALGMQAIKGGPRDSNTKLELALGVHALNLLVQTNQVEQIVLDNPMLVQDRSGGLEGDGEQRVTDIGPQPFIRIVRDEDRVAQPLTGAIVDVTKDTQSVINKVFAVDAAAIPPESKKGQFAQKAINKTRQVVSSIQAAVAKRAASRKHVMREDMGKVRKALSRSTIEKMAGIKEGQQFIQENIRKSQESANDDIRRDIDSLASFEETHDGSPFYLVPKIVQTQRANLKSNLVDPQNSKFHRHNVTMADWQTEIDPSVPSNDLTFFKLAVAQGMGIDIDKMLQERSLADFESLIAEQEIKDAVQILQNLPEDGKLDAADEATLLKAVQRGKQKFHSLDALVNLAEYMKAIDEYRTFSTDIMLEVDGVTNGPALAHLQLGHSLEQFGPLFGFYPEGSYRSYTEYKADPTNHDLYETVAQDVVNGLQFTGAPENVLAAISYFVGDLSTDVGAITKDGRKLVKQPLTAMVFGSGIPTAINDMAESFVDLLYVRLQEDANDRDLDALNATVGTFNNVLPASMRMPRFTSLQDAMEFRLDPKARTAAAEAFKNSYGTAVANALEAQFSGFKDKQGNVIEYGFMETRDLLNEAAQAMFARYNAAFEYLVDKKKQEKIKSGELAANNATKTARQPYQDLTEEDYAEIREELKAVAPLVHTAMSKASGELNAGLDVSKVKRVIAESGSLDYAQNVKLGEHMKTPELTTPGGKPSPTVETVKARGLKEELENPGVRAVIMLIHALDSAIASYSYNDVASMNFHDALGLGMKQVLPGSGALNQNTYNLLAGYSLPLEMAESLSRSFTGARDLSPELQKVMAGATIGKGKRQRVVTPGLLSTVRQQAMLAEINKLQYLLETSVVDQYAFEGGSHSVTPRERKRVQAKLDSIQAQYQALYEDGPNPGRTTTHSRLTPQDTPWGRIAQPVVPSDPVLVKELGDGKIKTLKDAAVALRSRIQETAPTKELRDFQQRLLKQVIKVANLDASIEYIEADTQGPNSQPPEGVDGARGWYSLSANGESVYIKSPDFESSGVTTELLLHEMTHAALAQTINRLRNEKSGPKDLPALQGLQELDTLRELASDYVEKNGLTQFTEAVKDVDELVAWGMTSTEFQDQVLRQIQMTSTGAARARKHGLKSFIDSIMKLLFGGDKVSITDMSSGLGVLVTNTAFLFDAAERTERRNNAELHQEMAGAGPQSYKSLEIFEGLDNQPGGDKITDSRYREHLRNALTQVVNRVYPTSALEDSARRNAPMTAEDVYLQALETGEAPFASRLEAIRMTHQERFVAESVEVTLRVAMDDKAASKFARREAEALYTYARKAVQPRDLYEGPDWDSADDDAREPAERAYALIFTAERNADGKSEYLSRFMSASVAYKPLHDALGRLPGPVDSRRLFPEGSSLWEFKTWNEAIMTLVNRFLNTVSSFYTGTNKNQNSAQKIERLASKMAAVRAKREETLQRNLDKPDMWLETKARTASEKIRKGIVRAGESDFFQKNKNEFVQAVGNVASTVAGQRVVMVMDQVQKLRNKMSNEQQDIGSAIYTEFRGETDMNAWAHKLHTQANTHEQDRKRMMIELGKFVRKSFGRDLTKPESESLTRAVLRTDLTALKRAGYSLDEIVEMLADTQALGRRIAAAEDALEGPNVDFYLTASKGLGYFMAKGRNRVDHLLLNARNIAFMAGTDDVIRDQGPEAQMAQANQPIIDELVTLYAILHTSNDAKRAVVNVARFEANRTDESNGFDVILELHQSMQDEAAEHLFAGSEQSFIKGYTREIYDPYVDVVAATHADGAKLEKAGYVLVSEDDLPQDPADPNGEPRRLYKIRGKGLGTMITGFLSNTSNRRKGTSLTPGTTSLTTEAGVMKNRRIVAGAAARKSAGLQKMKTGGRAFDPTKTAGGNRLAPVLNAAGEVIDYRYMMEESTKDSVLLRDNRVDEVFGAMGGSTLDKQKTPGMNKAGVEALKAQYDDNYFGDQDAYLEFGPNSADPELAERYKLLPDETKRTIRNVWGSNTMYIRKDQVDLALGYRKYSLADMFDVDEAQRTYFQKFFVGFWENFPVFDAKTKRMVRLGKRAALRISQAEDIWQELVREVKDILVIKNFFTLLGNESSNLTILLLSGVPIQDIIRNKITAYQMTKQYQKDRRRKFELEKMLSLGVMGQAETVEAQQELITVDDAMARNPVNELIDAGMFQTLVEDIGQEVDPYSYKSRLAGKVDKLTLANSPNRGVRFVRGVGKTLLMTHDTPVYKFMNEMTVMSDFTSRYVLHEHLTTRKRDPMSTAESLRRARAAFVNYDVPTHKGLQYLNDTGLLWFTKYYVRIQMVILAMVRENPARALALLGLDHLNNIASILDSSMLQKWPGNLGAGALELPGAIKEIFTLKALTPL